MTQDSESIQPATESTVLFDVLAYAGIAPFLLGLWLEFVNIQIAGIDGRFLFAAYSACILSFLCGIWWAGALNNSEHPHRRALILLSNALALLAWVGVMLFRSQWGLLLLACGFLFVRWAESRLNPNRPQLRNYFRTRSRVSYLVITCHLAMLALAYLH